MPGLRLGGGREDRRVEAVRLPQAAGQLDAAHRARGLVVLPAGAREVAAHHALHGEGLGLHAPASTGPRAGRGARRSSGPYSATSPVTTWLGARPSSRRNQNRESCVSTTPFSGIARGQHHVERADAVGGHDQQPVARGRRRRGPCRGATAAAPGSSSRGGSGRRCRVMKKLAPWMRRGAGSLPDRRAATQERKIRRGLDSRGHRRRALRTRTSPWSAVELAPGCRRRPACR